MVGLTSWQALVERAELKPGHKVLIHAGAGGIGTFAIQLAKQLGAHVATTTSARNHELVRKLGADVVVDYTTTDFTKELSDYDVVYDTLGGDTLLASFSVVKPGGIVVSIGAAVPDVPTARELGRVIGEHGINTLWLTAALFNAIVDDAPEALSALEQLLIGG